MRIPEPALRRRAPAALLIAGLLCPALVAAHAGLVKGTPASRSTLTRAPDRIELCFNEEVELRFSSIHVLGPDGKELVLGDLAFGSSGQKCIVAPITGTDFAAGTYTVKYKVLSQDGHVVDYGYAYTVRRHGE
jgi:methionine-rich copper-binding protein CopC